jgi:hypothetical protein
MDSEELNRIKAYALSNEDINKILNPDTKIFTYPKFCEMEHIDEAFDELGRCIFLFLTESESSGHWLSMFKTKENVIHYFDPYGEKPEAQRKWLSQAQLEALGEGEPCLMNLLKESGYKVYSNAVPYQKNKEDINTCGKWCVARLICKDFNDKEYFNLVKKEMKDTGAKTPDDWVSMFIYKLLGK